MQPSQVRAAGGSPPQSQLTVHDVFRNAIILHTAAMTQPSQSVLSKQSVYTGKTSTRKYISGGYFVLPGYSQDTAGAADAADNAIQISDGILRGYRSDFHLCQRSTWYCVVV